MMMTISGSEGMMMIPLGITLVGMMGSGTSCLSDGPVGKQGLSPSFMSNNGFSISLK